MPLSPTLMPTCVWANGRAPTHSANHTLVVAQHERSLELIRKCGVLVPTASMVKIDESGLIDLRITSAHARALQCCTTSCLVELGETRTQ